MRLAIINNLLLVLCVVHNHQVLCVLHSHQVLCVVHSHQVLCVVHSHQVLCVVHSHQVLLRPLAHTEPNTAFTRLCAIISSVE